MEQSIFRVSRCVSVGPNPAQYPRPWARRLRTLEEENSRLKKLLAEAMLDNVVLKDLASKKW